MRVREGCGGLRISGFKSTRQAKRLQCVHAAVSNLLNLGGHLVKAERYRNLAISAFNEWCKAVA